MPSDFVADKNRLLFPPLAYLYASLSGPSYLLMRLAAGVSSPSR